MQWDEPVRSRDVAASRVPGTAGHVTLATAWTHAAAPPGRGAPSLMLWLDRPRAAVGEPVVLHLVTLGDAQCQGLGLLSGLQPVAGRIVVRAASAGRHQLAVRCVGAGGSVERSVVLVVPLPVLATSQLNRVMTDPAGADSATLPTPGQLSQLGLSVDSVHTSGDFFQEGRHALLLATVAANGATSLHFLARDEQGTWRDRSSELLGDDERLGCRGQAQAITADFNQDGKPDVFLACHVPAASSGLLAAPCCQQIVLLSQPDGRYRRAETAYAVWAAQIEAADIAGNGGIDILAFDANHTPELPQLPRPLLLGRGDGSFAAAGSARPGLPAQGRW